MPLPEQLPGQSASPTPAPDEKPPAPPPVPVELEGAVLVREPLRGPEVTLLSRVSAPQPWGETDSQGVLELGDCFNAAQLWLVALAPGSITFLVEAGLTRSGPWLVLPNPQTADGSYTFSAPGGLSVLAGGARFLRVRPTAVTGTWTVVATPYVARSYAAVPSGVYVQNQLPVYREGRVVGANLDASTTGVKLTYQVPSGKYARVLMAVWQTTAGTPTVALEVVLGGVVFTITSGTNIQYLFSSSLAIWGGDVVRFNVTTAGAAGAAGNAFISYVEMV